MAKKKASRQSRKKKDEKPAVSAPEPKKKKTLGSRDLADACLAFERPLVEMEKKIDELRHSAGEGIDLSGEIASAEKKLEKALKEVFDNLTPWQRVQVARHPLRPYTLDYIDYVRLCRASRRSPFQR